MIRVLKPTNQIPGDWLTKASSERDAALKAFKNPNSKAARSFAFKAYGDPLLRKALNAIYLYKCAYCESFYGATQPVAVEHYRPKGEVIEGRIVNGDIERPGAGQTRILLARCGLDEPSAELHRLQLPPHTGRNEWEGNGAGKGKFLPAERPEEAGNGACRNFERIAASSKSREG